MDSHLLGRRVAAIAGLSAIIAMGVLSACAREAPAPEKVTVTKTVTETAAPPTERKITPRAGTPFTPPPSEKNINPTGGNLLTPPVQATPAPNVPPGQHPGIGGTPQVALVSATPHPQWKRWPRVTLSS